MTPSTLRSSPPVVVTADGSLIYTQDTGFMGTDSFTYRSMTSIEGVPDPVLSNVATVVVTTAGQVSGENLFMDGFE